MKRERMLQVAFLALLGLFYVGLIYPLYTDLAALAQDPPQI